MSLVTKNIYNYMPRKCHNHRQQTNQWHPEEEIHKVNICCTYSWEASQYETLQSLIEMSPMSAPGICFCNIIQKAVMLYIKLKKMKRRKLAPTPTPHTPKKTLHLHCQTPRKSSFSKINRSEFEEQITNM